LLLLLRDVEMRIERTTHRWPRVPRWAIAIVGVWGGLIAFSWYLEAINPDRTRSLCLFKRVTGHPCPTCGTTRLLLAACHGEWIEALAFNPLTAVLMVAVGAALLVQLLCRRRVVFITSARWRRIVTAAIVVAVLANWTYVLLTQ
jgi:hypothetical protein